MSDANLKDACWTLFKAVEPDFSDEKIIKNFAAIAKKVYLSGFNSSKDLPKSGIWYID